MLLLITVAIFDGGTALYFLPCTAGSSLFLSDGRWILPALSLIVLSVLFVAVVFKRLAHRVRGYLVDKDGKRISLYAENLVGSGRKCDIRLRQVIQPRFGFITAAEDGLIELIPLRGTFSVSGKEHSGTFMPKSGDRIKMAGETFKYEPPKERRHSVRARRGIFCYLLCAAATALILVVSAFYIIPASNGADVWLVLSAFALLLFDIAAYVLVKLFTKRAASTAVSAAFLICTLSITVTAAYNPSGLFMHTVCITAGLAGHILFEHMLSNKKLLAPLRISAMAVGAALLVLNVLNSSSLLGARNWLELGGINFQPSELVKISVILAGAGTLKAAVRRSDVLIFMGYSAFCVLCMALISDFGAAVVFFFAFLVMLWMRRGATDVLLSVAAAGAGCGLLAIIKKDYVSYAIARVLNWGSAWDNVLTSGYQQSRAMMACASGGLFGVGIGKGWLGEVFAAGSDMPFAVLWEEAGLICAGAAMVAVILIVLTAIKSAAYCGSCFNAVSACGTAAVFTAQTILNVAGTLDMLPFTGLTFPFLSTGGTSMIACWLLLAFISSAEGMSAASAVGGEEGEE